MCTALCVSFWGDLATEINYIFIFSEDWPDKIRINSWNGEYLWIYLSTCYGSQNRSTINQKLIFAIIINLLGGSVHVWKKNIYRFHTFQGGGLDQKCEISHFFFWVRTSLSASLVAPNWVLVNKLKSLKVAKWRMKDVVGWWRMMRDDEGWWW